MSNLEVKKYLSDIELLELSGHSNKIYNKDHMQVVITKEKETAEGIIKMHHDFVKALDLLQDIGDNSINEDVKKRIEDFFDSCIG